jgi:hypothetical protein
VARGAFLELEGMRLDHFLLSPKISDHLLARSLWLICLLKTCECLVQNHAQGDSLEGVAI